MGEQPSPWRPWTTWSAHPIPGVEVDRVPQQGLRPYLQRKDIYGQTKFAGGEYEREVGAFNQWKVV
jgi:hypothetical protein